MFAICCFLISHPELASWCLCVMVVEAMGIVGWGEGKVEKRQGGIPSTAFLLFGGGSSEGGRVHGRGGLRDREGGCLLLQWFFPGA